MRADRTGQPAAGNGLVPLFFDRKHPAAGGGAVRRPSLDGGDRGGPGPFFPTRFPFVPRPAADPPAQPVDRRLRGPAADAADRQAAGRPARAHLLFRSRKTGIAAAPDAGGASPLPHDAGVRADLPLRRPPAPFPRRLRQAALRRFVRRGGRVA
ncbi:hypothetical protein SDC9_170872 [bioreactor metagenome]|uniref:Uncharacterized protein n=1 Tax=bioreactor metagenome TaxID=1076179 RepID=A0A645GI09_9ZZZZ